MRGALAVIILIYIGIFVFAGIFVIIITNTRREIEKKKQAKMDTLTAATNSRL